MYILDKIFYDKVHNFWHFMQFKVWKFKIANAQEKLGPLLSMMKREKKIKKCILQSKT